MVQHTNEVVKKNLETRVMSATTLSDSDKKLISDELTRLIGEVGSIHFLIDKSLLGGFRIESGDWIIDTSLKYKLSQMLKHLKEN